MTFSTNEIASFWHRNLHVNFQWFDIFIISKIWVKMSKTEFYNRDLRDSVKNFEILKH